MKIEEYLSLAEEQTVMGVYLSRDFSYYLHSLYKTVEGSKSLAKSIWLFLEPEDLPLWAAQETMSSRILTRFDMATGTTQYKCVETETRATIEDSLTMEAVKAAALAYMKGKRI